MPGLWEAVHDQRALLHALLARDGARARELMRDHVLAFERESLETVRGVGYRLRADEGT